MSALTQNLISINDIDDKEWLLSSLIPLRISFLRNYLSQEVEETSWSMPLAYTKNKKILDFLRSDEHKTMITGYSGIAMARADLVSITTTREINPEFYIEEQKNFIIPTSNNSFSANFEAKGRGKQAYVEIIKTSQYNDLLMRLREIRKKELAKLEDIINHK